MKNEEISTKMSKQSAGTLFREKVRKKSAGLINLVAPKSKSTSQTNFVRNPTSYIELAIQEVGIPLTVKILDTNNAEGLSPDDILTIHQKCEIPKFECIRPNGDLCEIPCELPCQVNHIPIDESEVYGTVGDVLKHRKRDNITWIVVTKPFVYQAFVYNPGLIFEVLNEESDNEMLSVEVHPGRLLVFLPLQIRGDFLKSDSPYFVSECKLPELQDVKTPFFITPTTADINRLYTQNILLSRERLFVRKKKYDHLLIACTTKSKDDTPQIHVFPEDFPLKCEILLGGKPVDMLSENELCYVKQKLIMFEQKKLKGHITMTYGDAGLRRIRSKRSGKLKKKDIASPTALDNVDYFRYMDTPTTILKELNLSYGTWGCMKQRSSSSSPPSSCESPSTSFDYSFDDDKARYKRKTYARRSVYSLQFEHLSISQVVELLENVSLGEYGQVIRDENIDGKLLTIFDVNDFVELGLEKSEAEKLYSFVNGDFFGSYDEEGDDNAIE